MRFALRALGHRGGAPSPTYVLSRVYRLPRRSPWSRVVHIDAYRIRRAHEEAALDLAAIAQDPDSLLIIEWPERLSSFPWHSSLTIRFSHTRTGRRIVTSQLV